MCRRQVSSSTPDAHPCPARGERGERDTYTHMLGLGVGLQLFGLVIIIHFQKLTERTHSLPFLLRREDTSLTVDGTCNVDRSPTGVTDERGENRACAIMSPAASRSIVLLFGCVVLIHSEQSLLAPNMSAVAKSFGFDDQQKDHYLGGGLAIALFLVGAPAALLVGLAADGWARRVDLLVLVLALGTIGCAGSGISTSYRLLYASRALTGVSLGGALPLVFSLLGDLAPPSQRTALSGRIGLAMAMGNMGGLAMAGFFGPSCGWRLPFGVVALAMAALALRVRATMHEPPRQFTAATFSGGAGGSQAHGGGSLCSRCRVFTVPTVLLVFVQGVPGCVPHGVIGAFLPDFLHVCCQAQNTHQAQPTSLIGATFRFPPPLHTG